MSIRKTKYGYQVDITIKGIRYKKTWKNRDDARFDERELQHKKKLSFGHVFPKKRTISSAIEDYLVQFTSSKISCANEKRYLSEFESFMRTFHIEFVHEIELVHLQKLQKHLLSRGISGATVNRQFNSYKNFIKQCRLWNFTKNDPCFGLKGLSFVAKKKRLWNPEDIWRVCARLKLQWQRDAFELCVRTGIRPIEVLRLKWENVNLDDGTVDVTVLKGSGEGVGLKTRTVGTDVIELLKVIKARGESREFVIVNTHGNQAARIHLTNAVTGAAKALGLNGVTLYGVKHTLASNLRERGIDLETIRQILGHSNLGMTQRYLQNIGSVTGVREALDSVYDKRSDGNASSVS